jgi:hypothetical protein
LAEHTDFRIWVQQKSACQNGPDTFREASSMSGVTEVECWQKTTKRTALLALKVTIMEELSRSQILPVHSGNHVEDYGTHGHEPREI